MVSIYCLFENLIFVKYDNNLLLLAYLNSGINVLVIGYNETDVFWDEFLFKVKIDGVTDLVEF